MHNFAKLMLSCSFRCGQVCTFNCYTFSLILLCFLCGTWMLNKWIPLRSLEPSWVKNWCFFSCTSNLSSLLTLAMLQNKFLQQKWRFAQFVKPTLMLSCSFRCGQVCTLNCYTFSLILLCFLCGTWTLNKFISLRSLEPLRVKSWCVFPIYIKFKQSTTNSGYVTEQISMTKVVLCSVCQTNAHAELQL